MLILNALFVVILQTVNAQHAKHGKPCTLRNFRRTNEGNQALRPSDLISNHAINSLAECHILCDSQENCYGYNYREKQSNLYTNCQLSNSTVKMNKTNMKNGPWDFYEDVLVIEDADECAKGTHQCSQKANCRNTPGSYKCLCQIGYEGNGKKCNDVDECQKRTHKCDKNANCTNTPGSFDCQCRRGYTGEGRKCEDIDECKNGTHKCKKKETCTNIPGSYKCEHRYKVSEILKNETVDFDRKLSEWLPSIKDWNICWRASRDGWESLTFHSLCDGKSPTLTIVKVVKDNKNLIFGGYATTSWAGNDGYASAPGSFMFSLRNNDNLPPFKSLLKSQNDVHAIYRRNSYGPTFGWSHDIYISSNPKADGYSSTGFASTYESPNGYIYNEPKTKNLLAGSFPFIPFEIEVLY